MKIEIGSVGLRGTITKLKGGSLHRSSSFFDDIQVEEHNISTQETSSLNSLFTLQENLRDKEIFQKADDLLNLLDNLRKEMLLGMPTMQDLYQIETLAQDLHQTTNDPRLQEILMQIETRAAVELAKRSLQA